MKNKNLIKMAEKELTPEEQRAEVSKMTKSILEDKLSQGVYGANTAHKIFGDEGESAYSNFMRGDAITKAKTKAYDKKKESYKKLGVVGEPSMPTDGDFSAPKIQQINEMLQLSTVGDLEGIVNSVTGIETNLPENLKNYDYQSLFEKGIDKEKESFDESKLTDEEKDALVAHNQLVTMYKDGCAYKVLGGNYLADEVATLNKIKEKYNPKKEDSD